MPPHFYPLDKNRSVRFYFSGLTVLLASLGGKCRLTRHLVVMVFSFLKMMHN
jgi:hypothetical protein